MVFKTSVSSVWCLRVVSYMCSNSDLLRKNSCDRRFIRSVALFWQGQKDSVSPVGSGSASECYRIQRSPPETHTPRHAPRTKFSNTFFINKKCTRHECDRCIFGRGRRTWTLGTRFWRPLLYQLSYTPIEWWAIRDSNPGPTGYEPVALTNWANGPNRMQFTTQLIL